MRAGRRGSAHCRRVVGMEGPGPTAAFPRRAGALHGRPQSPMPSTWWPPDHGRESRKHSSRPAVGGPRMAVGRFFGCSRSLATPSIGSSPIRPSNPRRSGARAAQPIRADGSRSPPAGAADAAGHPAGGLRGLRRLQPGLSGPRDLHERPQAGHQTTAAASAASAARSCVRGGPWSCGGDGLEMTVAIENL
jgi:hypothetical protein